MFRIHYVLLLVLAANLPVTAEFLRVPRDHSTIQAAIDASTAGDTILVSPGRYEERIRLRSGITLKSDGGDNADSEGMVRAKTTILDGRGKSGESPGVVMATDCVLDGFTVTRVGVFDDSIWKQHFESQGEQLGDDEGSVQAEGTTPAISIQRVRCVVTNCIVHHNGDVGIALLGPDASGRPSLITNNLIYRNLGGGIGIAVGAQAIVQNNHCKLNLRAGIGCRAADPVIVGNTCSENIRAGIGCREGSKPIIRGNVCFQNRRAGIGIRMQRTAPVVEANECYENAMAGIGSRDGASPLLRDNVCHQNKMAGIGCDGSRPLLIGNRCRDNQMAGIGLRGAASAVIHRNHCLNNKLVAIGITQGSTALVTDNDLSRAGGGAPPLIAVKDASTATIQNNRIAGGGVAGILVQGQATIRRNQFQGAGDKQGNAIWVWKDSTAVIDNNEFDQYRSAVNASESNVTVTGNTIRRFQNAAIIIKGSSHPPLVHGNRAISSDPSAKVIELTGPTGIVSDNVLQE